MKKNKRFEAMICNLLLMIVCIIESTKAQFLSFGPKGNRRLFFVKKMLVGSYKEAQIICSMHGAMVGSIPSTEFELEVLQAIKRINCKLLLTKKEYIALLS